MAKTSYVINADFEKGQIVYLKTDPDQAPRIVTAIVDNLNGLLYQLCYETECSTHYAAEISEEKNYKP